MFKEATKIRLAVFGILQSALYRKFLRMYSMSKNPKLPSRKRKYNTNAYRKLDNCLRKIYSLIFNIYSTWRIETNALWQNGRVEQGTQPSSATYFLSELNAVNALLL